jgi:hypothetical protein
VHFVLLTDHSTQQILAQHESAAAQYNSTLHKLAQINVTVSFLLNLLDKTRQVSVLVAICGQIQFLFTRNTDLGKQDSKHKVCTFP